MISVFYVQACEPQEALAAYTNGQPPTVHELAKFFDRGHAEAHAAVIEGSSKWTRIEIVERSESAESQHPAHRKA